MGADPNQAAAAFTEYAGDHLWVASHLTQLAGIALLVLALTLLAGQLPAAGSAVWARMVATGAPVSLAVAAALQAVDGVALKHMVDAWAAAPMARKEALFQAAFAVRQIEIGLAAMFGLAMGLTVTLTGVALLCDRTWPRWVGASAVGGRRCDGGRRGGGCLHWFFGTGYGDQHAGEHLPAGVGASAGGLAVASGGVTASPREPKAPCRSLILCKSRRLG